MFNIHKENIINYGLPRTDRLFSRDTLKDKKEFLLMYPEIGSKKYVYMLQHFERIPNGNANC
ncbi:hypothetical protein K4E85_01845 [Campylobacter coli]